MNVGDGERRTIPFDFEGIRAGWRKEHLKILITG